MNESVKKSLQWFLYITIFFNIFLMGVNITVFFVSLDNSDVVVIDFLEEIHYENVSTESYRNQIEENYVFEFDYSIIENNLDTVEMHLEVEIDTLVSWDAITYEYNSTLNRYDISNYNQYNNSALVGDFLSFIVFNMNMTFDKVMDNSSFIFHERDYFSIDSNDGVNKDCIYYSYSYYNTTLKNFETYGLGISYTVSEIIHNSTEINLGRTINSLTQFIYNSDWETPKFTYLDSQTMISATFGLAMYSVYTFESQSGDENGNE